MLLRKIFVSGLSTLLIFGIIKIGHQSAKQEPMCGSLVIVVPTKRGLLIMADRLAIGMHDGASVEIDKLLDCENFTVVASTGMTSTQFTRRGQRVPNPKDQRFNASRLTRILLKQKNLRGSIRNYLPAIATSIVESLKKSCSFPDISAQADQNNRFLLQTIIYHYNRQERKYEISYITVKLKDPQSGEIEWEIQNAPDCYFRTSRFVPAGSNEWLYRISNGERICSKGSANVQLIRKYLKTPPNIGKIDTDEALKILSEMFLVSYLFEQQERSMHSTGLSVDALEISPNGKRWLYRRHPLVCDKQHDY